MGGQDKPAWTACPQGVKITRVGGKITRDRGASCPGGQDKLLHRQGQTIHCGQNFDDNRKVFSRCPYVTSFKMISSKSDFIHISNDFIHVYSPEARSENPLGTNFWCQQKARITSTICCKFQINLFEFWFYIHSLMFFNMYIAPGQTLLCGQNSDVNR